jgi:hypothetical protein
MERLTMAKTPTPESIAAELTVPERILLFCVASDTDWQAASVTHATAQHMMVRGLIERDQAASRFVLTKQARAVLAALPQRSRPNLKGRVPDFDPFDGRGGGHTHDQSRHEWAV